MSKITPARSRLILEGRRAVRSRNGHRCFVASLFGPKEFLPNKACTRSMGSCSFFVVLFFHVHSESNLNSWFLVSQSW